MIILDSGLRFWATLYGQRIRLILCITLFCIFIWYLACHLVHILCRTVVWKNKHYIKHNNGAVVLAHW